MKRGCILSLLCFSSIVYGQNRCTANPAHVSPGGVVILRCGCQGQISWTAKNGGRIVGSGLIVKYDTTGVETQSAIVNVRCSGKLLTPPLVIDVDNPPAPQRMVLCSLSAVVDTPIQPSDKAAGCLDDVAVYLQHTDEHLVVMGKYPKDETDGPSGAARRAIKVKEYLVTDRGISGSRIELRVQAGESKQVALYAIPKGAGLILEEREGSYPVDEVSQKPIISHNH